MKRFVLTGGPSCGKTTLIDKIQKKGFSVVSEVAKDIILKTGTNDFSEFSSALKLQNNIINEQLNRERKIDPYTLTVLDRGIYDVLVYCEKLLNHVPEHIREKTENHKRYDKVFLLERLPFVKENFRIEKDESEAIDLHSKIKIEYERKGYALEIIPVLPIQERVDYLIERIRDN